MCSPSVLKEKFLQIIFFFLEFRLLMSVDLLVVVAVRIYWDFTFYLVSFVVPIKLLFLFVDYKFTLVVRLVFILTLKLFEGVVHSQFISELSECVYWSILSTFYVSMNFPLKDLFETKG